MELVKGKGREKKTKKRKVAWGISGSGDRITETVEVMKQIRWKYRDQVDIRVYLSKAGEQVVKWYRLVDALQETFGKFWVEMNSNSPFLAGEIQTGKFEFLLIAPATANTVAKLATGIGDSLLCNAALMGLKAFVPLYVMPSDYQEGTVYTRLPNGRDLKLRIRTEDVAHVRKLADMEDVFILKHPQDILQVFIKHFKITDFT